MRWIGFTIVLSMFVFSTGGALVAAAAGWGLPGLLDKPITVERRSVRHGSVRRGHGMMFIYFGSRRRHYGGGYGYGK